MPCASRVTHEFVEFMPDELAEGTIYVSIPYATATHRCCCGCGTEIVTPLAPTDWSLMFDGRSVSLYPSIGSSHLPANRTTGSSATPWSGHHRSRSTRSRPGANATALPRPTTTAAAQPSPKSIPKTVTRRRADPELSHAFGDALARAVAHNEAGAAGGRRQTPRALIPMAGAAGVVRVSCRVRLDNARLWAIHARGYPVCPHEAEDAMTSRMPGSAERLEGRTLGRWRVLERIDGHDGASSVGYRVAGPDGESAYLKAYDFSRAFASDRDFPAAIEEIARSYRLERDLVTRCNASGMSRVVRGLDQGEVQFDDSRLPVMYIVFELAEGDLRHRLQTVEQVDVAARLQMLHHAAVGLSQLHGRGLVHQDIKPANVLTFADEGAKLGDLAHACEHAREPALETVRPGDRSYAPPEALYGFAMGDIDLQRQARDVYLFGSLILFAFVEVSATSALLSKLAPAHRPKASRIPFEEALPYLIEAFDQVVEDFIEEARPPDLLVASFRELCHPDPRRRGDSKARVARHANPYSLQRHITRLNLLHNRARRMVAPTRRAA